MNEIESTPATVPPRRTNLVRLRSIAAGSVIAAVSVTGVGAAAAAPAQAADLRSFFSPLQLTGETPAAGAHAQASVSLAGTAAAAENRLRGIRSDLANAVAWGSVTQAQADGFYAQMQARIARGL